MKAVKLTLVLITLFQNSFSIKYRKSIKFYFVKKTFKVTIKSYFMTVNIFKTGQFIYV